MADAKAIGMHMSVTKEYLLRAVMERDDWRELVGVPADADRMTVIAQIASGPASYPIGKCDNFDPDTGCKGHTEP